MNEYNGLAVNIAESFSDPGSGRVIATAFSTTGPGGVETEVVYTACAQISRVTLRRFPDLVNIRRDTFGVPSSRLPRHANVHRRTVSRITQWDQAGGYIIAWDAPALLERIRRYGLTTPARILDLKVLHRVLFPEYRGRRDLNTLADLLEIDSTPAAGLVEEAELAAECGETIMEMMRDGTISPGELDGSSWDRLMAGQEAASARQFIHLCHWMKGQGRDPASLRAGWPVWE